MKATKTGTKSDPIYSAPLSAREARLLADWERSRRAWVTQADLQATFSASAARKVAERLVEKGVLLRVRGGRYLVRPLRFLGRSFAASAPVVAAALLQGERYILTGLWALTFHRLTEQQYASVLDVLVVRRRPVFAFGNASFVFHGLPTARLDYGATDARVEGVTVPVSTPERTLLDLLDLPSMAGDVGAALRHVKAALPSVSAALLIDYALRGSRPSTCQRLGVLLERSGVPERKLQPLLRRVRGTRSLLSMNAGAPRRGPVNRRWSVVENDL